MSRKNIIDTYENAPDPVGVLLTVCKRVARAIRKVPKSPATEPLLDALNSEFRGQLEWFIDCDLDVDVDRDYRHSPRPVKEEQDGACL